MLPKVMPAPEYVNYQIASQYSYSSTATESKLLTPYDNIGNRSATIARLKINVPFIDIVTRDMGFSVCPHCKARYVGHELKCQQMVTWYSTSTYEYGDCHIRGEYFVGDRIGVGYNCEVVRKTQKRLCNSLTVWDHQKEFDFQESFFKFVSLLEGIPEVNTNLLTKFSSCLPEGMEDKYRITLLEQQVMNQKLELERIMNGMSQIAEKMNRAGNSLCW